MSIFDMFRAPVPATAPAAPTPAAPATAPATPEATPAPTTNTAPATSPLDQFATLWDNSTIPPTPTSSDLFAVDPAKLAEAVKTMQFAPQVTSEQLQAIQQGGEQAMQVFNAALNKTAQNSFAQSVMAATKIVEQALSKAEKSYDQRIPQMIKQHQVSDNLISENPALSNPAVQPLIEAMKMQFTVKFPNASATEITAMAKQYITQVAETFRPTPAPAHTNAPGSNGQDFFAWLGETKL